ncbi:AraC family transcriptional regulator [Rhizobium sp. NPDC090275]|uniref:AraC family transcriptional regulator n=1 Tax=Rhizobium sp. NPDC090275 TaxID=3364498 RepID=UPI000DDD5E8C
MKESQNSPAAGLAERHIERLAATEAAVEPVFTLPSKYPSGHHVALHRHSRAQFAYARTGVIMVSSRQGRWMVPPEHALWIPAGLDHSVDMLGEVTMLSVYISSDALVSLPEAVRVVGLTDLARALIIQAASPASDVGGSRRQRLIVALLLEEIARLPDRQLGLPIPADAKLAGLCRAFLSSPTARLLIDDWAEQLNMSRRAFTRAFRRETGISLSTWRQQAALFTALPRLAAGESVTSVALDLGYESVAAFTTMFKRMLGAPPRTYFRVADPI